MKTETVFDQILSNWTQADFEYVLNYASLPEWITHDRIAAACDSGGWQQVDNEKHMYWCSLVGRVSQSYYPPRYFRVTLVAYGDLDGDLELATSRNGFCSTIKEVRPVTITQTIYEDVK